MTSTKTTKAAAKSRIEIVRWVIGYRPAKNGNNHNPTPEITWVAFVDGHNVASSRKRSVAKEIAEMVVESGEDVSGKSTVRPTDAPHPSRLGYALVEKRVRGKS